MKYDGLQSESSIILNDISASVQERTGMDNLTVISETFMARTNEIFSGYQPCELVKMSHKFDWLGLVPRPCKLTTPTTSPPPMACTQFRSQTAGWFIVGILWIQCYITSTHIPNSLRGFH
jgi:hypothetical protein